MLDFRVVVVAAAMFPVLAGAAIRQVPRMPAGFEETSAGFVAQEMGQTVKVWGTGAAIRTGAGEIRMQLVGAAGNPQLERAGDAGIRNELIGSDPAKWRTGIRLSEKVIARDVYPGVDVVWYGKGAALEYDFNLRAQADAGQIRWKLSGDSAAALAAVTQKIPSAYQMTGGGRREISAQFVEAADGTYSLALGTYDRSEPLTIDPALLLSSYLGGANADEGQATTVDSSGNFYIAGSTTSTKNGNSMVLLGKIPASGTAVQTVYGGTLGTDTANAITTDSSGNVYVVGATTSTDFPVVGPLAIQSQNFGLQKAFVVGFGSDLASVGYSAWFGGSGADEAYGIAVGPNSLLYIAGDTTSTDFLYATSGGLGALINENAFQDSNHGGYDGFLVSLSTAGVFNFATYLGGSDDDHAYGVAVDTSSNIYVVGGTNSTDFPNYPNSTAEATAFRTYGGNEDGFVIKLQSTSSTETYGSAGVWSIFLGGSEEDIANGVALDSSGNPYIAGITASQDFPVGGGSYQTTYQGGGSDGFVLAVNPNGLTGFWGTFLGSTANDVLNAIAVDSSGNIYVTGGSEGTDYPVTSGAIQSENAGGQDVVVTELNNIGTTLVYSTYLGGAGDDSGRGIALDTAGNIYIAGVTISSNFPVTPNTLQATYGGGNSDAFLAILGCSSGLPDIAAGGIGNAGSYSTTALSPGGIFAIFGSFFSCTPETAATVPLPTTLNGVSVQVNGADIPLFYVGEGQINAQLPYGTPAGSATITVTSAGGVSAASSLPVEADGPGLFSIGTQAAALNADGSLNTVSNGAATGSYVSVYFTGTGPLNNAVASGAAAPSATGSPLSQATDSYSATVGGQPANVLFLGLAPGFVGLGQANITIPSLPAGNYPLIITIGQETSNSALITVSN